MAEIDTKRIINLPDQSGYNSGDYVAIDNATNGTHRFPVASMVATAGQTVAPEYSASSTYAVGDFVIYDGLLYECTTAIETAEAWTAAHWTQTSAGSELAGLKNDFNQFPNGNYPQMGAGYANQLVSGLKKEDSTPYNFRRIPYDATLEEVKKIVGGTIVNNQLAPELKANNNWSNYNIISTVAFDNGVATVTSDTVTADMSNAATVLIAGHKYLFVTDTLIPNNSASALLRIMHTTIDALILYDKNVYAEGVWKRTELLYSNTSSGGSGRVAYQGPSGTSFKNVQVFDLTQDFGTAIADYVYSLETATAGAGVAWLKKNFPKQFDSGYQAYDAGTLKSIEGLTEHKTVGFNQWDEEYELGIYATADGEPYPSTSSIRSKSTNYIPIVSGTTYYFNTSGKIMEVYQYGADKEYISKINVTNDTITFGENVHYIRFDIGASYGTTYNHDICINLSDPTKNGTYEPYEAHSYALDSDVVLRGIPKLDSNNQLYYDGDEYLPDGTVNRRFGIVDMGTLDWVALNSRYNTNTVIPGAIGVSTDIRCSKYISDMGAVTRTVDKSVCITNQGHIYIYDTTQTGDASAFKTAMSGVYLVYPLTTPTTETADPYTGTQIVAPDGTEEYIYTDGAFELPVGHSSDYPVDVSGQLDDILDTPSANGTYTLKATVADGAVTYSWVADA